MEDFTLAKIAYEAYVAFTGWKTYNGRDMPQWDDLGLPIMRAWQAAAEKVVESAPVKLRSIIDVGDTPRTNAISDNSIQRGLRP